MIIEATQDYMQWLRSLDSTSSIRMFRAWIEELREAETAKALKNLRNGANAEIVIQNLANALSNKLMHPPCTKVREASREGHAEFIKYFHQLFDLDDE